MPRTAAQLKAGVERRVRRLLSQFSRVRGRLRHRLGWQPRHAVRLVDTDVGPLFVDAADLSLGQKLLSRPSYEDLWATWMRRFVRRGMCVADVGANIGYYTVLLGRLVGPGGQVLAFEPDPDNYALLRRNIEQNRLAGHVRLLNAAVAESPGTRTLYRDDWYHGTHSLAKANLARGGRDQSGVAVPSVSLDAAVHEAGLDGRVRFVKIDTQGAEGSVLRGAARLLAQPKLVLMVELWPYGLNNCGSSIDDILHLLQPTRLRPFRLSDTGELRMMSYEALRSRVDRSAGKWDSFNVVFLPKKMYQQEKNRSREQRRVAGRAE